MMRRRFMQVVWVLAAGLALASLPFLQYRWPAGHHHHHDIVAEHGGH